MGARGGWSNTLQTVNRMEDVRPQPSLSQGLALGIGKAHRQQVHGGDEFRNVRRTAATGRKARVKTK